MLYLVIVYIEVVNIDCITIKTKTMKTYILEVAGERHELDSIPDECPFCHKGQIPTLENFVESSLENLIVALHCTNHKCLEVFLAYYERYNLPSSRLQYTLVRITIGNPQGVMFDDYIVEVSPQFESIFNEAYHAEQIGLKQICGAGFRKALEFLIKDYAILNHPDDAEPIKKMLLGKVITKYMPDERIKDVAKRAAWLGNDETHYSRKWENKDVSNLKHLINLTTSFIMLLHEHSLLEELMPEA